MGRSRPSLLNITVTLKPVEIDSFVPPCRHSLPASVLFYCVYRYRPHFSLGTEHAYGGGIGTRLELIIIVGIIVTCQIDLVVPACPPRGDLTPGSYDLPTGRRSSRFSP